jgi:hypothetical protein
MSSESKFKLKSGVVLQIKDAKCKTLTEYLYRHKHEALKEYLEYRQMTARNEKLIDKHCKKSNV